MGTPEPLTNVERAVIARRIQRAATACGAVTLVISLIIESATMNGDNPLILPIAGLVTSAVYFIVTLVLAKHKGLR